VNSPSTVSFSMTFLMQAGTRCEKCTVEMNREHLLPFGVWELLDWMHDLDPGIAHQNVDAAKCFDRSHHVGIDRVFVRATSIAMPIA